MELFEYILGISMEANLKVGIIGVSFNCINCVVFFMLNVYVRGVSWLIFCVNRFDNLNAGAFRPFTIGWKCWLGFWAFMRPFVLRAERFMFKYFHLESCGISVLRWFMVFLI